MTTAVAVARLDGRQRITLLRGTMKTRLYPAGRCSNRLAPPVPAGGLSLIPAGLDSPAGEHRLDRLGDGGPRGVGAGRLIGCDRHDVAAVGADDSGGQVHPVAAYAAHPALFDRDRFGVEPLGDAETLGVDAT